MLTVLPFHAKQYTHMIPHVKEEPVNAKLSVREAAPFLGVSVFTVRAWIRQHRLPFHRLGRRIVIDRGDLEAFLRAHRVPAREDAGR